MNEKNDQDQPTAPIRTSSQIGPGVAIKGELTAKESLTISGRFQGKMDLDTQDLVISAGGRVEAEVRARNLDIRGTLLGNAHCSGRVSIETSAEVIGDIAASSVSIQEGAKFKGSVRMVSPQPGLPLKKS